VAHGLASWTTTDSRHEGTQHGWWQGVAWYLDTGQVSFSCTLACCASEIVLLALSAQSLLSGSRRGSLGLLLKLHNMPAAKPSATHSSGVAQRVRVTPVQQRLLIHGKRQGLILQLLHSHMHCVFVRTGRDLRSWAGRSVGTLQDVRKKKHESLC
jgi:hypothetical protein